MSVCEPKAGVREGKCRHGRESETQDVWHCGVGREDSVGKQEVGRETLLLSSLRPSLLEGANKQ